MSLNNEEQNAMTECAQARENLRQAWLEVQRWHNNGKVLLEHFKRQDKANDQAFATVLFVMTVVALAIAFHSSVR